MVDDPCRSPRTSRADALDQVGICWKTPLHSDFTVFTAIIVILVSQVLLSVLRFQHLELT